MTNDDLTMQEKIQAVTELVLERAAVTDETHAASLGFLLGLITALVHPEWAAGIRSWLLQQNPPSGTTLERLGDIYVQNIPLEMGPEGETS